MSQIRVVITGLGVVSPIGLDVESVWSSLKDGRSGIRPISGIPSEASPIQGAGECQSFTGDIEQYGPLDKATQRAIKKNMKVMCREIEMGVAAAQKAISDSGLQPDRRDPDRCGCLFGCDYILSRPEEYADGQRNCRQPGHAETDDLVGWLNAWPIYGLPKVNPLWLLKYLPNMPNSHVSIYNDFRGPNNALTVREASWHLALAEATSVIQRGAADVMLVGATGSRIHPVRMTSATKIDRVASPRPELAQMSRPFDLSSDGMVLGEGAGAVVVESLQHARARGAKIWGEILGWGASMAGSGPQADALSKAVFQSMTAAWNRAADRLGDQWHVHAQGLSDPQFDQSEAAAINQLLEATGCNVPVTAAKSYFGNLGAGSAAVEMVCSLLAIDRQSLFPILNLDNPQPAVRWQPATQASPPGKGFIHSSCTQQGQSASIAIASI